jgi:hypothetical protein
VHEHKPGVTLNFQLNKNLKQYKVMKNPETKMCIELEGIILTEKALEKLRSLQANNNEYIEMNLKTIGDAVCRLACLMQECQMNIEQRTETTDIMSDLSFLRDNFVDLRKP